MATLVVWLARRGEFPHALHTRRKLGHVGRSIAGSGGMFANFIALSLLPLADATAFTFATPLLVVPMAALTLGEIVRPYRWAAVGTGFVGVLVMLSDDLGQRARRGGGLLARRDDCARRRVLLGRGDDPDPTVDALRGDGAIVFYFSTVTAVISAILLALAAFWPKRRAWRRLLRRSEICRARSALNSAC